MFCCRCCGCCVGSVAGADVLIMLITVDFEKMIEDDHEHCCGAEEEGEGVEGGVGDHSFCFCLFSDFLGGGGGCGG